MNPKGAEFSSAAFIKLAKEFHKLQPIGMDISAHGIDGQIQGMTNHKNENKQDDAWQSISQHTAHLIKNRGNHTGGETQSP